MWRSVPANSVAADDTSVRIDSSLVQVDISVPRCLVVICQPHEEISGSISLHVMPDDGSIHRAPQLA